MAHPCFFRRGDDDERYKVLERLDFSPCLLLTAGAKATVNT